MPTIKPADLAAVDSIERWRDRILTGVDDIFGWKDADPDTLLRRDYDPHTSWPDVGDLFNDTAAVCTYINQTIPGVDVSPVNRLFGVVNQWLLTRSADGLPTDEALEVAADSAMMLCRQAFDRLLADAGQTREVPSWNPEARTLTFRGKSRILSSRHKAARLCTILAAFQEDGWPDRIYNPLPPDKESPAERLHDAVKAANRAIGQSVPIQFHGDGIGQRIRWTVRD